MECALGSVPPAKGSQGRCKGRGRVSVHVNLGPLQSETRQTLTGCWSRHRTTCQRALSSTDETPRITVMAKRRFPKFRIMP